MLEAFTSALKSPLETLKERPALMTSGIFPTAANIVGKHPVPVLRQLCKTILEPLREFANSPEGRPKPEKPSPSQKATAKGPSLSLSPSPKKPSLSLSPSLNPLSPEIPLIISSGYRCIALNVKVGGAYASQHTLGEAADIQIPKTPYTAWDDNLQHTDMETAEKWFSWLQTHTDFDQLIMETSNGRDYWIHVSCRKNRKANRHQVLRLTKK